MEIYGQAQLAEKENKYIKEQLEDHQVPYRLCCNIATLIKNRDETIADILKDANATNMTAIKTIVEKLLGDSSAAFAEWFDYTVSPRTDTNDYFEEYMNKLYENAKLPSDPYYPWSEANKRFNKVSIAPSWYNIFDAGLLVEMEKAFSESQSLVVITGGLHAQLLDEFLIENSYEKVKEQPKTTFFFVNTATKALTPEEIADFFKQ